jgi:hypothetical protein
MSQVNSELGRYAYQGISLNDGEVRSLAGRPGGTISMSDLRGKSRGVNLYYSWAWSPAERGGYGSTNGNTNTYPGMTINGYRVYYIGGSMSNNGVFYSFLSVEGYPGRYFFNNLYGYDGRGYSPSGVSGGAIYSFFQSGGYSYWYWYVYANNGGLLYFPSYNSGAGYQVFSYN